MNRTSADIAPRISHPLRFLWGVAAALAIFFTTIGFATVCCAMILVTRKGWPADVLGRIWCRWIVKVCGIQVEVEGLDNVDPRKSYVIISNHLSNFDIWTTMAALPLNIHFVAKKELLKFPFFGWALALSDHIIIDRQDPESAIRKINERVQSQIEQGFCILFYGEGTRSPDGSVHAFKKGGVTLALRTGLPIVPLSVSGTRKFLPKGHAIIRPGGRVKLMLAKPIETKGYPFDKRDELNELVRSVIIQNYIEDY